MSTTKLIRFFSSLKLTTVLLASVFVLVFWATMAQVELGIYYATTRFFRSFFVYFELENGLKLPIFPGGYTLGALMTLNLILAHFYRFSWNLKKSGIWLTHVGLIILLVGSGITSFFGIESQLQIREGESKNYSIDRYKVELALTDTTDSQTDTVYTIPVEKLKSETTFSDAKIPFHFRIRELYDNADFKRVEGNPIVTQGIGSTFALVPLPKTYRDDMTDVCSGYIEVLTPKGTSLGTWLLSTALGAPQGFSFEGKTYRLELRNKRYYTPYSLTLLDFTRRMYHGTEIAQSYSSKVKITDPLHHENREVLIYMNSPLRYQGKTYYQASFGEGDSLSVLQVVENPSWQTPYISCVLMGLGLLIQFGIKFWEFLTKRKPA